MHAPLVFLLLHSIAFKASNRGLCLHVYFYTSPYQYKRYTGQIINGPRLYHIEEVVDKFYYGANSSRNI